MSSVEDFPKRILSTVQAMPRGTARSGDPREHLGALAAASVLGFSGCGGHRQGGPLGLHITETGDARRQYLTVMTKAYVVIFATIVVSRPPRGRRSAKRNGA